MGLGSGTRDPGSRKNLSRIRGQKGTGSRILDPGSGSATLNNTIKKFCLTFLGQEMNSCFLLVGTFTPLFPPRPCCGTNAFFLNWSKPFCVREEDETFFLGTIVADLVPVGSETFWPGRVRIWNNGTGSGS